MNPWTRRQLAPIEVASSGVVVVVDHDSLANPADISGQVEVVNDWWSLRATYERHGRRRPDDPPRLVIVVRPPLAVESLPWDIERASAATVTLRLPGPADVRAALRELSDDELGGAASAVAGAADPGAALLHAVTGITLVNGRPSRVQQLRVAARIAIRSHPSTQLARLARSWVADPAIASLLEVPADCSALQQIWNDVVAGVAGEWVGVFAQVTPELAALFTAGFLQPALSSVPVDDWVKIGIRRPSEEERARELLGSAPSIPPTDIVGWYGIAEWWGDLRRLIAHASADLRDAAWAKWTALDEAFVRWLRDRYGTLLTSAAPRPAAVHRIAPFLSRRLREGAAERVLLIVLDGLGHAQWSHLLDRLRLEVIDAGSTVALVPTYTTVSRQAIFAGELPASSPHTLWTTHAEARRWRDHWAGEGIPVTRVAYRRVQGRLPHDRLEFGDALVTGLVVNAVDDLMHTSELFGDLQLFANLDLWAANGFLDDLVARANAEGIETWVTADHGNLECLGAGIVSEGVAIEAAGKRLIRYPNRTLRNASAAQGLVWDDIPGLPSTAEPLLFAAGRTAFTNKRISVSHGGLSLDEVIVPLARVMA